MCLTLVFVSILTGNWQTESMEIYHRLSSAQIVLTENNELFILDRAGREVLHYNADGARVNRFGRKGQGPGEFAQPNSIVSLNDKLYVFDWRRVHIFSHGGHFIARFNQPESVSSFYKAVVGWIGLSKVDFRLPDEPHRLYWFSEDLQESRVLGEWPGALSTKTSFTVNYCNPAEDATMLSISPDKLSAAVKPINAAKIYLFDLSGPKRDGVLEISGGTLPFNKEWGQKYIEMLNRKKADCIPDFPDYFPVIQSMGFNVLNHLLVFKWSAFPFLSEDEPGRPGELLVFDARGKPVRPSFIENHGDRVVAIRGSWCYVPVFENEGAQSIKKIHVDLLEGFLKENPYHGDYYFETPPF